MFDRPRGGERAILVNVEIAGPSTFGDAAEFAELAVSAGVVPVATVVARRVKPDPKYFVGMGKAAEIRDVVSATTADVVLFDRSLSPAKSAIWKSCWNVGCSTAPG